MAKWEGDKKLEKRLVELHGRGLGYGDIAARQTEEFGQQFSVKSIDSRMFVLKEEGKFDHWLDSAKVGVVDIETTDFNADIGVMLSWAVKTLGEDEVRSDIITKAELFDGTLDRRICSTLVQELRAHDAIVTYFGTGFDNVFIRTRCLILGIPFFDYGSIANYDVYYTAKSKLKLHSKRLDSVARALGCETQKTPVDISVWQRARWGDKTSLDYVLQHNENDVLVLEEVYHKLRPFVKVQRKSI